MHWIADCVPMKSKDSSGKNKALKIFSNEYDSKLNRSIQAPLTTVVSRQTYQRRKGKTECYFVNIFFKYQNNINRPAKQCFLSVTNWEREGILDFVLHVVIIALISIFLFFSNSHNNCTEFYE